MADDDNMVEMLMDMYHAGPPEDGLPASLAAIAQDAISADTDQPPPLESPSNNGGFVAKRHTARLPTRG